MMLRFSLNQAEAADRIETAVKKSSGSRVCARPTSTAKATKVARRRWGCRGEGAGLMAVAQQAPSKLAMLSYLVPTSCVACPLMH